MSAIRNAVTYFAITVIWIAVSGCNFTQEKVPEGQGVVSAASPEAASAGTEILEAGGNAVDAAVAVSFALAVTEPAMSGLGGQSQFIIFSPEKGLFTINGTSYAPARLPAHIAKSDLVRHRAATLPTTLRTLDHAWQKHGSGKISWAKLLEPAIRFAENGFVIGPFRYRVFKRHAQNLRQSPSTRQLFLNADGSVPAQGEVFKQPVLAKTLRRLAEKGGDDFYRGEIASKIAEDMAANGGWITLQDLRNLPAPVELPALKSRYRQYDVYSLPPPGAGWVVLQILKVLEQTPPADLKIGSANRMLRIAEALQIGHKSRRENPVPDLVNYQNAVKERISQDTARRLLNEQQQKDRGETTHFSVVDAEGMVVGVTASINAYFGAKAAHPELGFLYNDYMHEFEADTLQHPYALRAGAMPYSSMSPTILVKDGEPCLVLGSPGSARIISAIVQVIQLWVDAGLSVQQAVAAPRIHVLPNKRLVLESASMREKWQAEFGNQGYVFQTLKSDLALSGLNAYFGGVHAIAKENGQWRGAADPRRDGSVKFAKMTSN